MPGIEETLRSLRDVQGVYGSFVVAGSGALVARDLPAVFDGDLFSEVGPRVVRLYETFVSGGEELDSAMLRFAEHKLYLRKMTWGVIGVLSSVSVNLPALRMVANLVLRKIDPEVTPSILTPAPTSTSPSAPAPRTPVLDLSPAPTSVAHVIRATGATEAPPPPTPRSITPPPTLASPLSRESTSAPARPSRMYRGRPVVDD